MNTAQGNWIEAPPVEGSLVINIGERPPFEWFAAGQARSDRLVLACVGDMLERMSHGQFVSTPHRVRNKADRFRVSFPMFLDPAWGARIEPLPAAAVVCRV